MKRIKSAKNLVTGLWQVDSTCPSVKKVVYAATLFYFIIYLQAPLEHTKGLKVAKSSQK